jgi:hypothetical protein
MRYASAGIVTVVALAVLIAGAPAARPGESARGHLVRATISPPPTAPSDAKSPTPAFLVALAARTATNNCDSDPAGASYVRTTRQAAETMASGDGVDSDQPVYLVLLRGDFVDYYAYGIYRTSDAFPRGTAIAFTVDTETHGILDFGIGGEAPNLTRLGDVHDFTAELRAAPESPSPPICG